MSEEETKEITNQWGSKLGIVPDIEPIDRYSDQIKGDDDWGRDEPNLLVPTLVICFVGGVAILAMAVAGAVVYGLETLGMVLHAAMNF